MTKLELINTALDLLGLDAIASLTTNSVAKKASRAYDVAVQAVMREHPWEESVTTYWLKDEATDAYTSHATNNDEGDLTFEVQESIPTSTPQEGTLTITIGGTEYEIDYSSWTGSIFTIDSALPADCDGDDTMTLTPNSHDDEYEYMYDLPTGCLRVLDINSDKDIEFIVEGSYLYTNSHDSDGLLMRYVKDLSAEVAGELLFSDLVSSVIAIRIAFQMSPITQKSEFYRVYSEMLADAMHYDHVSWRNQATTPFITEIS